MKIGTAVLLGCSALLGCDGKLGNYGDTEAQTGSQDDDGNDGTPVDLPDPGDEGQSGADDVVSDTGDVGSDDGLHLDLGPDTGVCDNTQFLCSAPFDCGGSPDACGSADSIFDAEGCLRPACQLHSECGSGEYCYVPLESGGCASSSVTCFDTREGVCECISNPDCGGGYCLPAALYPPPRGNSVSEGPALGRVEEFCGPDDALLWRFEFADDPIACGDQATPMVTIVMPASPDSVGSLMLDPDNFGQATWALDEFTIYETTRGVVRIVSSEEVLFGEYELHFDNAGEVGTTLIGSFSAVPVCPSEDSCP